MSAKIENVSTQNDLAWRVTTQEHEAVEVGVCKWQEGASWWVWRVAFDPRNGFRYITNMYWAEAPSYSDAWLLATAEAEHIAKVNNYGE